MKKLICWIFGHKWKWVTDLECKIYLAGECERCGEIGDGKTQISRKEAMDLFHLRQEFESSLEFYRNRE